MRGDSLPFSLIVAMSTIASSSLVGDNSRRAFDRIKRTVISEGERSAAQIAKRAALLPTKIALSARMKKEMRLAKNAYAEKSKCS